MYFFSVYTLFLILSESGVLSNDIEKSASEFIAKLNEDARAIRAKSSLADWNYQSNITDENLRLQLDASLEESKFLKEAWEQVIKFPWKTFKDETLKRMFENYAILGTAALSPEKLDRYLDIIAKMEAIYSKATICDYNNKTKCDLPLEPDVTHIMANDRNSEKLKHTWLEWYNIMGRQVKELFTEYVELSNEVARLNNFTNAEMLWIHEFHDDAFQSKCDALLHQFDSLYQELHAYTRYKLRALYGDKVVSQKGPLPAHLLGNVWGQQWGYLFDILDPFPETKLPSITQKLKDDGVTPLKMFKIAEEFFVSINMSEMTPKFWKNSVIEKPTDRSIVCHASAWDMSADDDFRIKMCTEVNEVDFYTVHHEMGHIEYDMAYSVQPFPFQEGANSGFHEAAGDTISLSVSSIKHLKKVGLLPPEVEYDKKIRVKTLLKEALNAIAFLPFSYLIDNWRWSVFNGSIKPEEYNCRFWELKLKYQGIEPPVERSKDEFDAAAKYHVVANVPYVRYFVSRILQFQFHKALCEKAGEYSPDNPDTPLSNCDIYQSKEAGNAFKKMLSLGSSKPWPDALESLTGTREMDATALLGYFKDLHDWLREENKKNGEYVGWEIPKSHTCGA